MGHYCRICGRSRPNERFSGKGHRIHVCKACQKLPKAEREYIEIMDELSGFLEQSNISRKNLIRLTELCEHSNLKVRDRASLILEIARVKPHKRRRFKFLASNRGDLLDRLIREEFGGDPGPDFFEYQFEPAEDQFF